MTIHLQPRTDSQPDGRDATAPLALLVATGGTLLIMLLLAVLGLPASPLTWYLARASGFTLYLLFWLSVVSGLGLTTGLLDFLGGRTVLWQAHRFVTELAYAFLAVHMLSLALDPAVSLGLRGVLLPFSSEVRQPWTDLGILTAYGMALVSVSFSLRRLIGPRRWRLLHYATFLFWAMGLVHGLGAGSDSSRPWAILLYIGTGSVILFLTIFRGLRSRAAQQMTQG